MAGVWEYTKLFRFSMSFQHESTRMSGKFRQVIVFQYAPCQKKRHVTLSSGIIVELAAQELRVEASVNIENRNSCLVLK